MSKSLIPGKFVCAPSLMYYRVRTLCRIDGYISDANTKVYGDGHAPFNHFFPFGMPKACDNTKATMKKQIRQIHSVFSHVGPSAALMMTTYQLLLWLSQSTSMVLGMTRHHVFSSLCFSFSKIQ